MSNKKTALVGIDPRTRVVDTVAINNRENQNDIVDAGLILVPTTLALAQAAFGEVVDDIYARFCGQ